MSVIWVYNHGDGHNTIQQFVDILHQHSRKMICDHQMIHDGEKKGNHQML